jgi:predicted nuclease of predicted toxin-antitoxin system
VKFLVDTQLPSRLCGALGELGHDAVHASQLARGNRSTDAEVTEAADAEDRVLVSKDRDFRDSHLLRGQPRRLLAVVTGNISNADLLRVFTDNLDQIVSALDESSFIELGSEVLVIHDERPRA